MIFASFHQGKEEIKFAFAFSLAFPFAAGSRSYDCDCHCEQHGAISSFPFLSFPTPIGNPHPYY
jgi:hypothetical protein